MKTYCIAVIPDDGIEAGTDRAPEVYQKIGMTYESAIIDPAA